MGRKEGPVLRVIASDEVSEGRPSFADSRPSMRRRVFVTRNGTKFVKGVRSQGRSDVITKIGLRLAYRE